MKTVNLLPEWYFSRQKQRNSLYLQVVLLLMLGGVMLGWTFVGRRHISQLTKQRNELLSESVLVRNMSTDLAVGRGELLRLNNLKLAYRELGNTIPMSDVVQQILNNMTPGMALSRVALDVQNEPVKGSTSGDPKHPPRFHNVAHLAIVGIAPNDTLIAQLIGKISANPLFNDVSLNFTRTEIIREYTVRRFEIQMRMDLEPLSTDEARDHSPEVAGGPANGY